MGLGQNDSSVKKNVPFDEKKPNGRERKKRDEDEDVEDIGCWVRFIGSCMPLRSKVDSSISGTSALSVESKFTNERSKDQLVADVGSSRTSATTINVESGSSTPKFSEELKIASQLRKFAFNDLKVATRNFRPESLLGEGGFGCVFKGWIEENGTAPVKPGTGLTVAVKTLNHDGLQGHKEWLAEVNFLGNLRHPNLVKLIGYCIEDDHRLLAYEFMPRGSLENHLFRRSLPLPWSIRMKIALGAAKGLTFLHEEAEKAVIYRDFKTSNILLDAEYNAKLSDFGLAKDAPEGDKTHVSTRVMGTHGYAAPEYVMTGHLTSKSDVYSFGVVLLEMLTGRRSMDKNRPNGEHNLVQWARPHLADRRSVFRLIDPRLEGHFSIKGAQKAARGSISGDKDKESVKVEVGQVQQPGKHSEGGGSNDADNVGKPNEGGGALVGGQPEAKVVVINPPGGNEPPVAQNGGGPDNNGGAAGTGGGGGKKKKRRGKKVRMPTEDQHPGDAHPPSGPPPGNGACSPRYGPSHMPTGSPRYGPSHMPTGSPRYGPSHVPTGSPRYGPGQFPTAFAPAVNDNPAYHQGYHQPSHYYAPPAYTVSYNRASPSTSYGASYYASPPPNAYAYMQPDMSYEMHPSMSYEAPPLDSESYPPPPSESFELFSDENPNACSLM